MALYIKVEKGGDYIFAEAYSGLRLIGHIALYKIKCQWQVSLFEIRQGKRRKGIGRKVFKAAASKADDADYIFVYPLPFSDWGGELPSMETLICIYQKLGFIKTGPQGTDGEIFEMRYYLE